MEYANYVSPLWAKVWDRAEKDEETSRKRIIRESAPVPNEPNLSSILTKLIQETGRFTESYASDLFVSWNTVLDIVRDDSIPEAYVIFGIRESGVDHNAFVESQMRQYGSSQYGYFREYYRRIYAVRIKREMDKAMEWTYTRVELADISKLIRMSDCDELILAGQQKQAS